MQYLGAISKMTEWSWFVSKTFKSHSNQVYTPTTHVEEAEVERFYVRLTGPFRTNTKKDVLSS